MPEMASIAGAAAALVAALALAWRARGCRAAPLAFWGLAAVGSAVSAIHGDIGHLVLAVSIGPLMHARAKGTESVLGIDVACLSVGVAATALALVPDNADVIRLDLLVALALIAATAAVAVTPAGSGGRGVPFWALLTGLGLLSAEHVSSVTTPDIPIPSVIATGAAYLALAVASLHPGGAGLPQPASGDRPRLRLSSFFPFGLALGIVPGALLVAEIRHGGVDAPEYAVASAAVGALVVVRAAVVSRVREEERAEHDRTSRRLRALVEHGSDVTCVVDDAGLVTYASPTVLGVLGRRPEQAVGSSWRDVVHMNDVRTVTETCANVRRAAGRLARTEVRIRTRSGAWRWMEVTITNCLEDSAVRGIVCNLRDIEEHKQVQQELRDQALHDALTGLPNRAMLLQRLGAALTRGQRDSVAVAFLDLDHFKEVNDSLGHEVGDELLVSVAKRIRAAVRPGDVVARFGGDEFVVVCEQLASRRDAITIVERLLERMGVPVSAGGQELHVTPSVGIAFATGDDDSPDTLIGDADAAMYEAKAEGRARYAVFNSSMREDALQRLETGTGLHAALKRDEFRVFYQPIVNVESGAVASVEALVRWQHPQHGLVGPQHFIELAEERGLISAIGERVLSIAAEDMRRWSRHAGSTPLELAVNISARQLRDPGFVRMVERALAQSGLAPSHLCLEVTENVLLEHADAAAKALGRLKSLGVRISIDDFGAGYTSLSYLKRFPVDVMKIDQSFVSGICDNSQDAAIVSAVIELAHTFGVSTVAEGVETPAQLARLAEMRCDLAQGYLFARPQPAHLLDELLAARRLSRSVESGRAMADPSLDPRYHSMSLSASSDFPDGWEREGLWDPFEGNGP